MKNVENLIGLIRGQKYQSGRKGQTGLECYERWLLYCEVQYRCAGRGNRGCLFPKKTGLEPASSLKSRLFCVGRLVG